MSTLDPILRPLPLLSSWICGFGCRVSANPDKDHRFLPDTAVVGAREAGMPEKEEEERRAGGGEEEKEAPTFQPDRRPR